MQPEDYAYLYDLEERFWWFAGMREITAALLDSTLFDPTKPRTILDAGCGAGGNLSWLDAYAGGGRVVGLDTSDDALRFCRQRGHERLIQASVADLPFTDACFDVVTSFDVLVQLPGKNTDERAVREMYRVLKFGGIGFVRVAAYEWMRSGHDAALGTQKRYTLPALIEMMRRAGFQILRATYANTFLLPVVAIRRLALKPLGLADAGSDVKPLAPELVRLNRWLASVLAREARLLRHPRRNFGAGLSAICVVRK